MKQLPHIIAKLPVPHRSVISGLALLIVDAIVFMSTDATKVASYVVIVALGLVLATLYVVFYQILRLVGMYGLHVQRKAQLAAYVTAFAACLLALQSVGELARRDVLVLAPLVLLSYVYNTYAKRHRNLDG